ncbi:hypothetical protein RRG08_009283 [Elysia crispata]|uniref:Uncharacterized protein n=1 Tax=Elysia crispata TaxID=231223 RepID=A0AAE0YFG2_9GAST|nr:hypothetical protein RRG08_009283 [Elysia crispata]
MPASGPSLTPPKTEETKRGSFVLYAPRNSLVSSISIDQASTSKVLPTPRENRWKPAESNEVSRSIEEKSNFYQPASTTSISHDFEPLEQWAFDPPEVAPADQPRTSIFEWFEGESSKETLLHLIKDESKKINGNAVSDADKAKITEAETVKPVRWQVEDDGEPISSLGTGFDSRQRIVSSGVKNTESAAGWGQSLDNLTLSKSDAKLVEYAERSRENIIQKSLGSEAPSTRYMAEENDGLPWFVSQPIQLNEHPHDLDPLRLKARLSFLLKQAESSHTRNLALNMHTSNQPLHERSSIESNNGPAGEETCSRHCARLSCDILGDNKKDSPLPFPFNRSLTPGTGTWKPPEQEFYQSHQSPKHSADKISSSSQSPESPGKKAKSPDTENQTHVTSRGMKKIQTPVLSPPKEPQPLTEKPPKNGTHKLVPKSDYHDGVVASVLNRSIQMQRTKPNPLDYDSGAGPSNDLPSQVQNPNDEAGNYDGRQESSNKLTISPPKSKPFAFDYDGTPTTMPLKRLDSKFVVLNGSSEPSSYESPKSRRMNYQEYMVYSGLSKPSSYESPNSRRLNPELMALSDVSEPDPVFYRNIRERPTDMPIKDQRVKSKTFLDNSLAHREILQQRDIVASVAASPKRIRSPQERRLKSPKALGDEEAVLHGSQRKPLVGKTKSTRRPECTEDRLSPESGSSKKDPPSVQPRFLLLQQMASSVFNGVLGLFNLENFESGLHLLKYIVLRMISLWFVSTFFGCLREQVEHFYGHYSRQVENRGKILTVGVTLENP